MTLGTGQFCTKPGLLFLPAGHGMEDALVAEVEAVTPAPMLNARMRTQRDRGLSELQDHADVIATSTTAAPDVGFWAAATLLRTSAATLLAHPDAIAEEYFGPNAVVVEYADEAELLAALGTIHGTLTASLHAEQDDPAPVKAVLDELRGRAGRIIVNGWPTGVAVTWSMQHGGPWPATTNAATTSVGGAAIGRWLRPVCYQDVPADLLPPALRDDNPWHLPRRIDGRAVAG